MVPYLALISIPGIIDVLNKRHTFTVRIGEKKRKARYFNCVVAYFVILFIMLALRDIVCGRDLVNYQLFFEKYRRMGLRELLTEKGDLVEPGYRLLNWTVGRFTSSFQWLLVITALLAVVPLVIFYYRESDYPFLTVSLFCAVAPFGFYFSGIRQASAMGFTVLAFLFARKKKLLSFLITVLIAGFIHRSAYVLLFIYPAYHVRFRRYWLPVFVLVLLLVLVFRHELIELVFRLLPEAYRSRYMFTTETDSYVMLTLLFLFLIYAWIIPDPLKEDRDILGLRNIMVISTAIQCFAPIHAIAMRYNYYFLLLIPVLIPKVIKNAAPRFRKAADTSVWVMSVFFTCYFFFVVFVRRPLECYPYVPFWQ